MEGTASKKTKSFAHLYAKHREDPFGTKDAEAKKKAEKDKPKVTQLALF